MSNFIAVFSDFAPIILIVSGAILLFWLLYQRVPSFRWFLVVGVPSLAHKARIWFLLNFPSIGFRIGTFLRWVGRMITNLFFFLAEIAVAILDAVSDWLANRRSWVLAHQFAEEIRRGELSAAMRLYATAATRCDHCHGSRLKPRWTVADATSALNRDLENQIRRGLCAHCLGYLAVAARVQSAGAVTPAVPAGAPAQPARARIKIDGEWFINFIGAGILLVFLPILGFVSIYSGTQTGVIIVKGMYSLVGFFLLGFGFTAGIPIARKLF